VSLVGSHGARPLLDHFRNLVGVISGQTGRQTGRQRAAQILGAAFLIGKLRRTLKGERIP
jgi:hypothetical protein